MCYVIFFFLWRCYPTRVMASSFLRFLDHTQRRTTIRRTALDDWCYDIIFHNSLLRTIHRIPKSVDAVGKSTCEISSKTLEELCNKASVSKTEKKRKSQALCLAITRRVVSWHNSCRRKFQLGLQRLATNRKVARHSDVMLQDNNTCSIP